MSAARVSPGGNGTWIGDHVPSTAEAKGRAQVLKPRCHPCSNRQGGLVRARQRAAERAAQQAAEQARAVRQVKPDQ